MRVLVLGGYGLIGGSVARHLAGCGHEVTGLGRDITRAARMMPDIRWLAVDLARMTRESDWDVILQTAGFDAIVNCAGVLQDGLRDRVHDVQVRAMQALYPAAARHGVKSFIQISAPGATHASRTTFMRTKAEADTALAASGLVWTVLRPGLVIAPQAYGGSALLRALAAFPFVTPVAYGDRRVQTVWVGDVAEAVERVLADGVAPMQTYDLVEDKHHTLSDVVAALRAWLGLAPATRIALPRIAVRSAARLADGLGWLGWRSPLRTTAIAELDAGVTGDPAPWRQATGRSLSPLDMTLRRLPSTVQERWFARAFLLKPLVVGALALFWIATGLIALAHPHDAAAVLTRRGVPLATADFMVYAGIAADLLVGIAVTFRKTARAAALGMIGVTLAYLVGGTLWAPDLWADPLGPLVKPIPALVLAVVCLALVEDR